MQNAAQHRAGRVARTIAYVVMLALGVAGFLAIRHFGVNLSAPRAPEVDSLTAAAAKVKLDALMHILLALAVIIVTARALAALCVKLNQPPVIGEVIAGLMLGPSLLGRIAPPVAAYVLPTSVAPFLGVLSQVGVVLYMFLVGVELDLSRIRGRVHSTVVISHASIVAPFLLGSGLALLLYPRFSNSSVPFTVFGLFSGVAMSVTAFPVLARILTDRGIQRSPMGTAALTCAAVDDVTAWCLLAIVVSVATHTGAGALVTIGLTIAYVALMIVVVRPALTRFAHKQEGQGGLQRSMLAFVCVLLLVSAFITEAIGIHAIFGAFTLGAMIPHDSSLAQQLKAKLEDVVVVFFLPAFFAYTGLRTEVGLLSGGTAWLWCGVILAVASAGKFGGSFIAARLSGLGWRDAAQIGVLMNTRGLVELIVLNIGLDLKVISPTLFAMLVLMAVVTTVSTTPILHVLGKIPTPMLPAATRAPATPASSVT
ncbi:MAG TPA: cation:proton antiporter [Polyangia bacterium]|jgi:Kef-type K+ transport system membrane component KefB|nr:cation:proton antiporter [Polyangia bacterium]